MQKPLLLVSQKIICKNTVIRKKMRSQFVVHPGWNNTAVNVMKYVFNHL